MPWKLPFHISCWLEVLTSCFRRWRWVFLFVSVKFRIHLYSHSLPHRVFCVSLPSYRMSAKFCARQSCERRHCQLVRAERKKRGKWEEGTKRIKSSGSKGELLQQLWKGLTAPVVCCGLLFSQSWTQSPLVYSVLRAWFGFHSACYMSKHRPCESIHHRNEAVLQKKKKKHN
jgi:hypothetical protein